MLCQVGWLQLVPIPIEVLARWWWWWGVSHDKDAMPIVSSAYCESYSILYNPSSSYSIIHSGVNNLLPRLQLKKTLGLEDFIGYPFYIHLVVGVCLYIGRNTAPYCKAQKKQIITCSAVYISSCVETWLALTKWSFCLFPPLPPKPCGLAVIIGHCWYRLAHLSAKRILSRQYYSNSPIN